MARVPDLKRIQKEDFQDEMREAVDKLAFPLNSFMEQTRSALDGNIDFTNLNREVKTIETVVDSSGNPTIDTKYRSELNTKVQGHNCIAAYNLNNTSIYPLNSPFISFIQNNNIVTILNITGLQAGQKYKLVLECIGQ